MFPLNPHSYKLRGGLPRFAESPERWREPGTFEVQEKSWGRMEREDGVGRILRDRQQDCD